MNEMKDMKISTHCILACLYFLLLPTMIAINSSGSSYLKLASIPIAAYFVITILFSKIKIQFNAVHFFLCLFTVSTITPFFVNPDPSSISFGYVLNAALYLCITVVRYNERELKLLEDIQVVLLLILVAITVLSNGQSSDRTTIEIFGQTSDPNYFVGFFLFPLAVTVKKIFQSKYRLPYIILAFLGLYCIFMSGSRGGFIALVVTLASFAIIYPSDFKRKFVILLISGAFILVSWTVIAPILPDNIIERMSIQSVVETGGSGRVDIWISMLHEIVQTPSKLIWGRGADAMHEIFIGGHVGMVVAHNQFIQVLFNQGIFGFMAYMMLPCSSFLRCVVKRKTVAIAMIGIMALSMSLSFNASTKTFWNLLAYAALNFPADEPKSMASTNTIKEEEHDGNTKSSTNEDGV